MRRELFLLFLIGCGDDEATTPARTTTTTPDAASPVDASTTPDATGVPDASPDAPITYPNPLEGKDAGASKVVGGFSFTEGPVWIGGRLLFSDIPNNVIRELLPDGGTSAFRTGTNGANGLAVDTQNRLWACQGGNKRVTRQDGTKGATVSDVTTTFAANAYNSPNDVIVRTDGNAYFTDPTYGGTETQDERAVYRVSPTNQVTRLAATFTLPNGIALSPDESTLYVVENAPPGALMQAPVNPDGTVGAFTKLADVSGGDGMAVDDAGNLYVTAAAGVRVFDKTGKSLGTVTVAEQPANCTFGGADRKTLYITARTSLYRIDLNVPGLP
jgi:gluconolactonase